MADEQNVHIRLIPKDSTPEIIEGSIHAYNQPLADFLDYIGLPTVDILSPVEERRKVIYALESTIEILPMSDRQKAVYLSKFTVSVAVGLFDGALNFLWNEVIQALRRLVEEFDLQYFFNVAKEINSNYKSLNSFEDLSALTDHDLLEICRRIGLISDINFKRLEHTNYLRNHASSAHPNNNIISGIEMLALLEGSLRYAITARPDHSVITIKLLFGNIRTKAIASNDFAVIGIDLLRNPQERVNDFTLSLLGLYVDPRQSAECRSNIEQLLPQIWGGVSEDTRYLIGAKYGFYRRNGDMDRKDAVQKLLDVVDGQKYKDEDTIASEMLERLQRLKTAHFNWYNFYNEYEHALSIYNSLPTKGIPNSIRTFFVKVICLCYIGNGSGYREGVDERAVVYYKRMIDQFNLAEIKIFFDLFNDPEFVIDFGYSKPDRRLRGLVEIFKAKTSDEHINRVLDVILKFPIGQLSNLAGDSRFKEAIKQVKP